MQYSITHIDTPSITEDEFINMSELFHTKIVRKFKIVDMCSLEKFEDEYKDKIVSLNTRGNILYVLAESKFSEIPENFYAWEDIETDEDLTLLNSLVKKPITERKLISTHIFKGPENTGANLHNHNYVVNYLIKGKKLWYVFPNTENNIKILENDGYVKREKQRLSPHIWVERKKRMLLRKIEGLQVIEHNEGEVLCLPDQWFHVVLNKEYVVGVSYSWYD